MLLVFKEVDVFDTGWNLAQMIQKILQEHNLTYCLPAITANNASNNTILRYSFQEALQSKSINLNANPMSINCLAHVFNLSAKLLL